jgi:hypothetical protein
VSERLIELVSKTSVLFTEYRGFESRPLRFAFGKTEQANSGEGEQVIKGSKETEK